MFHCANVQDWKIILFHLSHSRIFMLFQILLAVQGSLRRSLGKVTIRKSWREILEKTHRTGGSSALEWNFLRWCWSFYSIYFGVYEYKVSLTTAASPPTHWMAQTAQVIITLTISVSHYPAAIISRCSSISLTCSYNLLMYLTNL